MTSVPRGSFSTLTGGAPTISAGPCCRAACGASSLPRYGSPPPPVPRIAAPTAMSSSSASPTSRNADPPEVEVTDRLDADARRVAGQIGDRDVVDVHDVHAVPFGARGDRAVDGFLLRLGERGLARG